MLTKRRALCSTKTSKTGCRDGSGLESAPWGTGFDSQHRVAADNGPNSCYRGSDVLFWPLWPLLRIFLRTSLSADANNFNQIKLDQIRDAHV